MEELNEGFLDFLKRLWRSIVSRNDISHDRDDLGGREFDKTDDDLRGGYAGVENLRSDDPALKTKLAKVFAKGVRLHLEAEKLGVKDEDLMRLLTGLWKGRITADHFYELKQTGAIDRIYSRVRERIRYQRRKRGIWHENKV